MPNSSVQEVIAILGQPVAANPTQYVMEKASATAGLDWRFLTFEVAPAELSDALRGLRAMRFSGAAIAPPHESTVIDLLDELTPQAKLAAAVNAVQRVDDRLLGDNTLGTGLIRAIESFDSIADKHVLLHGTGPVAAMIAAKLIDARVASIALLEPPPEFVAQVRGLLLGDSRTFVDPVAATGDYTVPAHTNVVLRTDSSTSEKISLPLSGLAASSIVVDLQPSATSELLAAARLHGYRTIDSLQLLLHQSAAAFELWTRTRPDINTMREALEEYLEI